MCRAVACADLCLARVVSGAWQGIGSGCPAAGAVRGVWTRGAVVPCSGSISAIIQEEDHAPTGWDREPGQAEASLLIRHASTYTPAPPHTHPHTRTSPYTPRPVGRVVNVHQARLLASYPALHEMTIANQLLQTLRQTSCRGGEHKNSRRKKGTRKVKKPSLHWCFGAVVSCRKKRALEGAQQAALS